MMVTVLATLAYVGFVVALFLLARERSARTSASLWIPVFWLLISGSRPVSLWLETAPPTNQSEQYLDGSPLDRAVFAALLCIGLVILLNRKHQVLPLLRKNVPILIFVSYCALSVCWSDFPFVALKRWVKALGDVVMVAIVLTDPDRLAASKRFLTRVGFVLLPLSVLIIKYYPALGRQYNMSWELMYSGVAMQKNELGIICVIFGLASLWRLLTLYRQPPDKYRRRQLLAHSALLSTAIWLLWIADSVTSINCFIIGGGLMLALSVPRLARRAGVVHLLVAIVVLASCSVLFLGAGASVVETMGRNSTLTGRTAIWELVLRNAGNPWFGAGFESFWLGDRLERIWAVDQHINEAHNGYLEVYLNLGWVGVSLLALVVVTSYRNILRKLRQDPNSGALYVAYFSAALIYSLTEAGFRMMNPMWICFLLAGVATPKYVPQKASSRPAESEVDPKIDHPWPQEQDAIAVIRTKERCKPFFG
jgi:exopolysaccharide production protein ExoQ